MREVGRAVVSSKPTWKDLNDIRARTAQRESQKSSGADHGIGSALCSQIVRNRIWNPAMYVPLTWHDLRHECAFRWLEDGLDVREIRLRLGHAKLEITQRYLNITDVGVVRSMRELWGRRRAAGRAQG